MFYCVGKKKNEIRNWKFDCSFSLCSLIFFSLFLSGKYFFNTEFKICFFSPTGGFKVQGLMLLAFTNLIIPDAKCKRTFSVCSFDIFSLVLCSMPNVKEHFTCLVL